MLAACSTPDEQRAATVAEGLSLPAASYSVTLETPPGVDVTDVAVGAQDRIEIGSHASVKRANAGPARIVNHGAHGVEIGPFALAGHVASESAVTLKPKAHLIGGVVAPALYLAPNATVDGTVDVPGSIAPPTPWAFTVAFPAAVGADVSVKKAETELQPGRYRHVRVWPHGKLALLSGTYYFESLTLMPNSTMKLRQAAGATRVFAQKVEKLDGTLFVPANDHGFLLAHLSCDDIEVHLRFQGVLLAPNARIRLSKTTAPHIGAFFGREVKLEAHGSIVFRAANPLVDLLFPESGDLQRCAELVRPRDDLADDARERAYQADIARYCTMRGANDCTIDLVGRANVEYFIAAGAIMGGSVSPAQYLAVVRDRARKLKAAQTNPSIAQALCSNNDSDGDWVPDATDQCPGTPDLTHTNDFGCPDPALPPAPSAESVKLAFERQGFVFQAACDHTLVLQRVPAGAFFRPADASAGTYILSGRVMNQPAQCPVWYFFDVEEWLGPVGSGQVVKRYMVSFKDTEEVKALIGSSLVVPPGTIQFNPRPTDAGTRGLLGSAGPTQQTSVRFRVRAMNGAGMRSDWSEWKFTTKDDCLPLGFSC